jgi:N-acetylneuraminic acid mutarotase
MNKIVFFVLIIIFISGTFVATPFNPVLASDVVEDSWNTKTPMTHKRQSSGVVAADNKIYVIGGDTNMGYQNATERYDPVTDSWVTLKPMPTARRNFAIATYHGKIYCIGGVALDPGPAVFAFLDVNEVYDIATDSWSTKAPLPIQSDWLMHAHVVDEKIFVVTRTVLYMYDPVTDLWTNRTNTPTSEPHAVSAVVDDKIFVIDLYAPEYFDTRITGQMKVMIYDPKTNGWSEGQTGPELTVDLNTIAAGATTGLYAPKKIYVSALAEIHADGGSFVSLDMINHVYDPVTDTWSVANVMPLHRGSLSIAVCDDVLYAVGGGGAINEQYVPLGYHGSLLSVVFPLESVPEHYWSLLSSYVVIILVLVIGIVVMGLLFYSKNSNKR